MENTESKDPIEALRVEFYKEQRDNNKWWFTAALSLGGLIITASGIVAYLTIYFTK